jgi:hypothetical protein
LGRATGHPHLANVRSIVYDRSPVAERISRQLVETSFQYVVSRRAFEVAIEEARRAGWSDEEVTHVTGLPRRVVELVAGKQPAA